ncbi:hypothetical protein [Jiangella asiatica]|nr:hypothetical protein [Jiangella asiatica]
MSIVVLGVVLATVVAVVLAGLRLALRDDAGPQRVRSSYDTRHPRP